MTTRRPESGEDEKDRRPGTKGRRKEKPPRSAIVTLASPGQELRLPPGAEEERIGSLIVRVTCPDRDFDDLEDALNASGARWGEE